MFLQDDWHVKPRLTVNLGIRYELNTVPKERDNLIGNFDPTLGPVQVGSGSYNSAYNGDHNNFAPRLALPGICSVTAKRFCAWAAASSTSRPALTTPGRR